MSVLYDSEFLLSIYVAYIYGLYLTLLKETDKNMKYEEIFKIS